MPGATIGPFRGLLIVAILRTNRPFGPLHESRQVWGESVANLKNPVNTDLPSCRSVVLVRPTDQERPLHSPPRRVTTPGMPAAALPPEIAKIVDEQAGAAEARPSMIWIGDGERPEFAAALAALRRHAKVTTAVDMDDAARNESTVDCAGIVIAQAFAGQFRARCLAALRRRFPPAPVVVIVGSFTEGERRSGDPLAAALRIPWAQAAAILDRELRRLRCGTCPSWGFGETLTDDERAALRPAPAFGASNNANRPKLPAGTTLLISAADHAAAGWLTALVDAWGVAATFDGSSAAPDVILWEVPSHDITAQCRLQSLARRFPGTPIVALANFPRPHLLEVWRRHGVVECCALPVDYDDILQKLIAVIERRQVSQARADNGIDGIDGGAYRLASIPHVIIDSRT